MREGEFGSLIEAKERLKSENFALFTAAMDVTR
jgi:hypothetical protein